MSSVDTIRALDSAEIERRSYFELRTIGAAITTEVTLDNLIAAIGARFHHGIVRRCRFCVIFTHSLFLGASLRLSDRRRLWRGRDVEVQVRDRSRSVYVFERRRKTEILCNGPNLWTLGLSRGVVAPDGYSILISECGNSSSRRNEVFDGRGGQQGAKARVDATVWTLNWSSWGTFSRSVDMWPQDTNK